MRERDGARHAGHTAPEASESANLFPPMLVLKWAGAAKTACAACAACAAPLGLACARRKPTIATAAALAYRACCSVAGP